MYLVPRFCYRAEHVVYSRKDQADRNCSAAKPAVILSVHRNRRLYHPFPAETKGFRNNSMVVRDTRG